MKRILTILLLSMAFLTFAEEEVDFFSDDVNFDDMDFDDMFGDEGDESFIEVVDDTSDQVAAPSSELLTTKGVEFGGSFSSSISAGLTYEDFPSSFSDITDEDKLDDTFSPTISATLQFNARPTENTRYFGKVSTELPFYNSADVLLPTDSFLNSDVDLSNTTTAEVQVPDIKIEELFTDFNYDNKLFFRVGKQNAKWGVGYFFSPADFLSLESIDPEDPLADREGPIAIKLSMPFGLNNLYTYITVPNSVLEDGDGSVSDLILAPMVQFLLGDTEISSGIYYQKDSAPRAMVSATYGTNTDFGQFSLFGEAVGLYGSDKTFVYQNSGDYTTETYDDTFFFNGTVGFMWSKEIVENNFTLVAQYFYNGEGYNKSDSEIVGDIINVYSGISINDSLKTAIGTSDFSYGDIVNRNQHYLGANFSITNLFNNEDLSISAFTMMNLVDISGYVKPSISYTIFDDFSVTLGTSFNISDEGDEYYGDRFSIDLTFKLGGGNF